MSSTMWSDCHVPFTGMYFTLNMQYLFLPNLRFVSLCFITLFCSLTIYVSIYPIIITLLSISPLNVRLIPSIYLSSWIRIKNCLFSSRCQSTQPEMHKWESVALFCDAAVNPWCPTSNVVLKEGLSMRRQYVFCSASLSSFKSLRTSCSLLYNADYFLALVCHCLGFPSVTLCGCLSPLLPSRRSHTVLQKVK